MKIVQGEFTTQLRCVSDDDDMLLGMITKKNVLPPLEEWRIELFMKIDGTASTKEEAVAFARGCEAMGNAFGLFNRPQPQNPNIVQRQPVRQLNARTPPTKD